ncbi:HAD family phosphatase [Catenovulum sp. SM1970]|uniref:HAD family hydrolase n=1 Tax=Marinifaba aquimaris TaxID=2741323 RepID=UPI0015748BE9|nr:HAD family phosphatase [Marinifaba aquimaris]NTS75688.1 HAD family phosphatase [Marinifaba aquimaris]
MTKKTTSTPIQAILFDMDGTIFDTEVIYESGWIETAEAFGQSFTKEDYKKMVGVRREVCHQIAKDMFGPDFPMDDFIAAKDKHNQQVKAQGVAIKQGFEAFFQACLKKNLKLGLVTSSHRAVVDANFARLTHFDYLKHFDCIVAAEDVTQPKPEPECYLKAAKQINVAPESCLVIEDSNPGCRAAIAASCPTLMIPDFLPAEPDVAEQLAEQVSSFDQAYHWLDNTSE